MMRPISAQPWPRARFGREAALYLDDVLSPIDPCMLEDLTPYQSLISAQRDGADKTCQVNIFDQAPKSKLIQKIISKLGIDSFYICRRNVAANL
jgi:hypothetical protein